MLPPGVLVQVRLLLCCPFEAKSVTVKTASNLQKFQVSVQTRARSVLHRRRGCSISSQTGVSRRSFGSMKKHRGEAIYLMSPCPCRYHSISIRRRSIPTAT